jgi:RNA polymerase sigma-32 factor
LTISYNVNGDNLQRYARMARSFPMLSVQEEKDLVARWRDEGDQDALQNLIGSHLRLVIKFARQNSGYGLPLGDLVAEGCLGLMQAANRFDPDRGVRFATYATWWIRATMHEHILYSWSLVKLGTTAAQKKLFFNLRRLKGRLQTYEEGDLSPENAARIAVELGVREDEVVEMNRRLAGGDWALNAKAGGEDQVEFQDLLVDEAPSPEDNVAEADELAKRRVLLTRAIEKLDERERHIVAQRTLSEEPMTLDRLSKHFGISRERVRQLEARAIEKLRTRVLDAAAFDQIAMQAA